MKVEKTKGDKLADAGCILLLIANVIFVGFSWRPLPDTIPAHYNVFGEIDRWGSKTEILLLPAIACLLYVFMKIIEHNPRLWNTGVTVTEDNRERVYCVLQHLLSTMKLEITGMFLFLTLENVSSTPLSVWFLPVSMAVIFGSLFFWIFKLLGVK